MQATKTSAALGLEQRSLITPAGFLHFKRPRAALPQLGEPAFVCRKLGLAFSQTYAELPPKVITLRYLSTSVSSSA